MLSKLNDAKRRVVGIKQVMRALEQGELAAVYIADDADARLLSPLCARAAELGVPVHRAETMAELGNACHIQVGAAAAAVRR